MFSILLAALLAAPAIALNLSNSTNTNPPPPSNAQGPLNLYDTWTNISGQYGLHLYYGGAAPTNLTALTASSQNNGNPWFPYLTAANTLGSIIGNDPNTNAANVYLIYYGTPTVKGNSSTIFTPAEKQLVSTLINGISTTSYWNIVQQYNNLGAPATNVAVKSSVSIDCTHVKYSKIPSGGTYNCNLVHDDSLFGTGQVDDEDILQDAINGYYGALGADCDGIYVILADSSVNYTWIYTGSNGITSQNDTYGSDYCGRHDVSFFQAPNVANCSTTGAGSYQYSYVQLPNATTPTNCLILPNGVVANDPYSDSFLLSIIHELVESILVPPTYNLGKKGHWNWYSSFQDQNGYEPMDKCESIIPNLQTIGNVTYNMAINTTVNSTTVTNYFIVPSLWNNATWSCVVM